MWRSHLLLPSLAFAVCVVLLQWNHADLWLADRLYAWSGGAWRWRDAWLTEELVHAGGRKLVAALAWLSVLALLAGYRFEALRPYRSALLYLLGSAVVGALLVNIGKRLTHIDCPWDLQRYGGELPYIGLFDSHPGTFPYGECFPAGHASAGYAWLGLYYVVRAYWPRWRLAALAAVLVLGGVFGLAQQLRGAHFLSHDLWSLMLCWSVATLWYLRFPFGKPQAPAAITGMGG